jgi:enoyl-CoA hydratase/carnithine racemase
MAEAEAQAAAASEGGEARSLVRYEAAEGLAVLALDDPPANTYTYEMMRQLDSAVLRARMDDAVHVIVITGAGEKFFCAGANISMLPTRLCRASSRRRSSSSRPSTATASAAGWRSRSPPTSASRAGARARWGCPR